jgi:alpha-D-ribose 1-methylphosphonate 5-triphosphate synthase subunit PhnH
MSAGIDLAGIGAGFEDPVLGAQEVFRDALQALARPGRIVAVSAQAAPPQGVHPAANALLLALLDHDTRLWLSPGVRGAADYLRFHTGCVPVCDPAEAHFALAAADELAELQAFAAGSDERPDDSATVVLQVDFLSAGDGWRLAGPGIRGRCGLSVRGARPEFAAQWARNHASFPRGVDVFLACGASLCGLPRTTRIEA